MSLKGIAPNTATVEIQSDAYFMECDGYIGSSFVSCLNFTGGRGAFRYISRAINVSGFHIFEHCQFEDYRECAIGNNSVDHPYLKVQFCMFKGDPNHSPIGIAWGGYIDGLNIQNCSFLWNKYHLKLGPRLSGSISVRNNDFIKWFRASRAADIWIVPNTSEPYAINSGLGFVISENKFGNENQLADEPRIIVALEQDEAGSDRLTRHHSEHWAAEGAYLQGLALERNRICGISGLTAPIIKCFIQNVLRFDFCKNFFDGGSYTYLCEFADEQSPANSSYTTNTWNIELDSHAPGTPPFTKDISNQVRGPYRDLVGSMQGLPSVLLPATAGDDVGFHNLLENDRAPMSTRCEWRHTSGSYGSASAMEITFLSEASNFQILLRGGISGRISWIECDVRQSEDLQLERAIVRIFNSRRSFLLLNESFALTRSWETVRIPFVFSSDDASAPHVLQFMPQQFGQGTRQRFCLDRIRVYHARHALNGGHLRTTGSGSWDEQHIVLGETHIWIDKDGELRIKPSAPLFDSDGRTIGARTAK